jgi:hypothetical protein
MEEKRDTRTYRDLIGKSEDRRLLGRPKGRWDDIITVHLNEIRWVVNLIGLG